MCYVYVIYNKDYGKIYIGQCKNTEDRLKMHNNKTFKNSYTAKFDGIWDLIYKEEAKDRLTALAREKQLKSYKGRLFIKNFIPR